jgi:aspartyl-tRNA(Asn)/glutamyl-tRNA(Gln) amidotransferase subunit B
VSGDLSGLLDDAIAAGADARPAANWLAGEITAHLNREGTDGGGLSLDGVGLAELVTMVTDGALSATAAKDVLAGVLAGEGSPSQVAASRDLMQVSDEGALRDMVEAAIAANPDEAQRLRDGEDRLLGFFVGQVMASSGGKADPGRVASLVRDIASQ